MEFQHREPQIIERINAYLGHRAVDRLKLIQGPMPNRRPAGAPLPPLSPADSRAVDSTVSGVGDSELRSRLVRLGRSLTASHARRAKREN
jgi:hypothetical protein